MCELQGNINENELLNIVMLNAGLTNASVSLKDGTITGDNYVGMLSRIKLTGAKADGGEKVLDLIFKYMPTSPLRRQIYNCETCFAREIFMYETVLPYFTKMEETRGISAKKRFKYAKMYGACSKKGEESLVLEDLSAHGFILKDRTKSLDFFHCKIVMEAIAQFHAFSFALKDQNPDLFKAWTKGLRNVFVTRQRNEEYSAEYKNGFKRLKYILGSDCNELQQKKLEAYKANFLEIADMFDTPEAAGEYGVIVHGDTWINNLLFQYKEETDINKPTSVCLIDYQIPSYTSPVLDISYLIYMSTDKALREQHLDDLLNIYYSSLERNLAALGSNVQKMFPYNEFQEQMKKFASYGFFTAVLLIHLFLGNNGDSFDPIEMLSKPDIHAEKIWKKAKYDDYYRTRLKDIFYEMCTRNYI